MNPLTRALKLAEDPQPGAAATTARRSGDPTARGLGELGPVRATRDDPDSATPSPAPLTIADARGPDIPDAARLTPRRAAGDDRTAPGSPDSAPPVLGGAPSDSAGAAASDAGAARAVHREGFRSLPGSRGVGSGVGIALSMLVAAGAAAGGGALLWTTELARPALVRSLPPLPEVAMDPTPVRAGNAAGGESREPAGGTASTPQDTPTVSPPAPGNGIPSARTAAPPPEPTSIGVPAPGAPGDARGSPAEHDSPVAERDDAPVPERDDTPVAERDDTAVAPGSGARIAITKRTRADHVAESLERAYEAYLAGDGEAAGQAYRAVLRDEPRNRDALLGLAAVAAQAGLRDEAAEHYATLLASHPADTAARAALVAIHEGDPWRAESRLKALLRIEPEAAHLHFTLGNHYAAQSRWPEAQQSWFRAYRLERANADHAYNLAVGLDHLSQSRHALALYREALVLARGSRAGFEAEAVRERIRALESHPDARRTPDDPPGDANAAAAAHVR